MRTGYDLGIGLRIAPESNRLSSMKAEHQATIEPHRRPRRPAAPTNSGSAKSESSRYPSPGWQSLVGGSRAKPAAVGEGWRNLVFGSTAAQESQADRFAESVAHEAPIASARPPRSGLTEQERDFFEPRLGADLSNVQVHTGRGARASAKTMGVDGYTFKNHVVLRDERISPQLLAHELVHVTQQGASPRVMPKVRFEAESEEGASNEALAFFKSVGLSPSHYAFTNFDGGKATVEGRGPRPATVAAEIVWAYLQSLDLYDRKVSTLQPHIQERMALINNAKTVGLGFKWGKVATGGGKVNAAYWEILRGPGGTQMRSKKGVNSVDAIDDVKTNPGNYGLECFSSVALIQMLTERERLGASAFQTRYPQLVIHFTNVGGVVTSIDINGFEIWDIGSNDNTLELIPGDQSNWKNLVTGFNENFLYVGAGTYYAHPAGLVSGKADFASKVAAAGAAADLYMTQYRYRWKRWLP